MVATVTHAFVSGKSDGSDSSQVQPSNWNANHVITGLATVASTGAYADLTSKPGSVVSQSGSYTAAVADAGSVQKFTANATFNVNASTLGAGWWCDVKNLAGGSNTVTITPASGTVDGTATLVLNNLDGIRLFCDGTNFETLRGIAPASSGGISSVNATVTSSTTISGTGKLVPIAMTSLGQSVTLPDATTLSLGGPLFVLDNSRGGYAAGVRDNGGNLLFAIAPGGKATMFLQANSVAAGTWDFVGTNLEAGLITIDQTLSTTYTPGGYPSQAFVALDSNTSIHLVRLAAGGVAAFICDNTGKVLTTPVAVDSGSTQEVGLFKVSSTSAILFYVAGSSYKAVVLTVSGSSPSLSLAVGTAATASGNYWINESPYGVPTIAQLTGTLYVISQGGSSNVVAVSVSGSTVTIGTAASSPFTNGVGAAVAVYPVSSTTAMLIATTGTAAPYAITGIVASVSGTTLSFGTAVAISSAYSVAATPPSCQLSSTLFAVMDDNNASGAPRITAASVSGTTITAGSSSAITDSSANVNGITYSGQSAYRNTTQHLMPLSATSLLAWYANTSTGIENAVVCTLSGTTVNPGTVAYKAIASAASNSAGFGYLMTPGASDFSVIRERTANTAGYANEIMTFGINGTAITNGKAMPIDLPTNPGNFIGNRFSNGTYVIAGSNDTAYASSKAQVWSSNGVDINYKGSVALPEFSTPNNVLTIVGQNRLAMSTTTQYGSPTATQARFINLEVTTL